MLDFILISTSTWDAKFNSTTEEDQTTEEPTEVPEPEEQNANVEETPTTTEAPENTEVTQDTEINQTEEQITDEEQAEASSPEEISAIVDKIFKDFEDSNAHFEIDPATMEKLEKDPKARAELIDRLLAILK